MFSTCTLAIRIEIFPRWMAFLGYALALLLLLSIGRFGWAPLVFPLWTLMISEYVLSANFVLTAFFSLCSSFFSKNGGTFGGS